MRTIPGCRAGLALFLLASLAGCDDPAIERGVAPPIAIDIDRAVIPLYRFAAGRVLRERVATLAPQGDTGVLHARIETLNEAEAEAARDLLIRLGFDPVRIVIRATPANTVALSRIDVGVAPCSTALHADWLGDVRDSVTSLGTCVQTNNLAEMLDDPVDLIAPQRLGTADGAVSADAVHRWEQGRVKQPNEAHPQQGDVDYDAGASPSAASDAPPQSPGSVAINPLAGPLPVPSGANAE